MYNTTITNDPTAPQVCRYTNLWNISVLKATGETIHFKSAPSSSMADTLNMHFDVQKLQDVTIR